MISLTSPVRTRAHGWPAGFKLSALCGATAFLFSAPGLGFQVIGLCLCLGLYALPGRIFFRDGLRRLYVLWPFAVGLMVWHAARGAPEAGMMITLRMVSAVGLANLVTMTTRLSDMQALVFKVLRPLRFLGLKPGAIGLAIALVVRFTPELSRKGWQLTQAWRARALRRPGWRVILPLAVLAIDDADHVADALKARGGIQD